MQSYPSGTMLTTDDVVQLQIFLSARGLYDMDVFSKSDPYVKVYFKRGNTNQWGLLGRTETIDNNLNPNFQKSFVVDYIFEAKQELKFEVYDEDDKNNANNDDFIGRIETTLGACAGARDQTLILNLQNRAKKNKVGKLIIRVEPANTSNEYLKMKWRARKLMNTDSWFDFWDKSDPYLKFLKIRQDNTLVEAGRTAVIMDDLNPNWKPIDLSKGRLIRNQNQMERFKIECWDWEEEGEAKHQFIGQIYVTLPDLMKSKLPLELPLSNPKHKKPGKIILENMQIYSRPTFVDYLRGGLQLNLSVAIDFTASNGIPSSPNSLHRLQQYGGLNFYQQAIMSIGNILLNYDSDKKIPAFGFGAKLRFPNMNGPQTSHCFPLSGNPADIEAFGIEGLMQMYMNSLTHVDLSGPTYFGPILQEFINLATQSMQEGSHVYQILLILTDGVIHDMDQTIDLLVRNCNLPLSIIICGIGNADFGNMDVLDGDNGLYNKRGQKAARDIVQFVPFNKVHQNPDLLARQLLAELPGQVVQYMTMMGKMPNKPNEVDMNQLMMESKQNMNIEQNLKNNLPQLFANLAGNPYEVKE